jgi:hypothetical protein
MSTENCDYRSENEKEAKKPQKPSKNLLTGGRKSSILKKVVAGAAQKAAERDWYEP